ncbi:MAG: signal peptidase I [Christensenellales bacterium]
MSVPTDSVFVMGDNREKSIDSRRFGTVKKDDIYGKVLLRYFPFNKITIFG